MLTAVTTLVLAAASPLEALPMGFAPNRGQGPAGSAFHARGPGYRLALSAGASRLLTAGGEVRAHLEGAAALAVPFTEAPLPGRTSEFRGRDPRAWVTDLPTFARAGFRGVWPGIDVVYHGDHGSLEYDFRVAPGADPGRIRLRFEGAGEPSLTPAGALRLALPARGEIQHHAPRAWEERGACRVEVAASWRLEGRDSARFVLGPRDPRFPLVIDPTLSFSSWLGGSDVETGGAVAVDAAGMIYVAGDTLSLDFPTRNAVQPARGGNSDAFAAKIDPASGALLYSTYLGGNGDEFGWSLDVDGAGRALLAGYSYSSNFPTTSGAFQAANRGLEDAYVALLSASGTSLVFSTLLGGSGADFGYSTRFDPSGDILISGTTSSRDFPLRSPLQGALLGPTDAFLARLDPAGATLAFSTLFGGSGNDDYAALAPGAQGAVALFFQTGSTDLPMLDPIQTGGGATLDLALARIDVHAPALRSSTYLIGSGTDEAYAVATDAAGAILLVGETSSTDLPSVNALQGPGGLLDGFLFQLSPDARSIRLATHFGGSREDQLTAVASAAAGDVVIAGTTVSPNLALRDPIQAALAGGTDAFVARLSTSGAPTLLWSTYHGGNDHDRSYGVAADPAGKVYVAGYTESADFPALRPVQAGLAGTADAFVVRIDDALCLPPGTVGNTLRVAHQPPDLFLTWQNVPGATGYNAYQDASRTLGSPQPFRSAPDGPTGILAPFPPEPQLFFHVRAANACGEGP